MFLISSFGVHVLETFEELSVTSGGSNAAYIVQPVTIPDTSNKAPLDCCSPQQDSASRRCMADLSIFPNKYCDSYEIMK